MSKYAGEQVLVVPRALFDSIGSFQGIRSHGVEAAIARLLDPENHLFMDRDAAERDPSYKQLIPYCVIRCGTAVLNYTRGKSGGEERLHALRSVGVGGHITPIDTGMGRTGPDAYHAAVERELPAELVFDIAHTNRIVALLNDDSNEVGRVHLGVIHLIDVQSTQLSAREDALANLSFNELIELKGPLFGTLEGWSQHVIQDLENL
ncbi:MAG: nudix hydrolase domain-like [Akkermansiaceae bacterium]|nr:nudix hydrolase domain-like [Akkermansiaceae bacterium]